MDIEEHIENHVDTVGTEVEGVDFDRQTAIDVLFAEFVECPGVDDLPAFLHTVVFDAAVKIGIRRALINLDATLHSFEPLRFINGVVDAATIDMAKRLEKTIGPERVTERFNERLAVLEQRINGSSPDALPVSKKSKRK